MPDLDGWLHLGREAVVGGLPAALVLLGLHVAVRAGVHHGIRDAHRDAGARPGDGRASYVLPGQGSRTS